MKLMARKPLDLLLTEARVEGQHTLKRALGTVDLIALGVGATIGAGIFVITGSAAAQYAGPAIVLSFVLAGFACVFAGLCYAEFASLIPVAGSAYTYGYATLGELLAWVIGWDLILEYAFSAATVASGWSANVVSLLQDFGIHLPPALTDTPGTRILFYNGRTGQAAVGKLSLFGDFIQTQTISTFSQGWTHIVPFGGLQPGCLCGHLRGDGNSGDRGQGIGQFQHCHRGAKSIHGACFHRRGCQVSAQESVGRGGKLASIHPTKHGGVWKVRLVRNRPRRCGDILRIYRIRFRVDGRSGG